MTENSDREITIAGKKHTLQPFKLKQLRQIARMGGAVAAGEAAADTSMDFGFDVLTMALQNVLPPIDGELDDLPFEGDELQDALSKVMKLAALKPKGDAVGEAKAPETGA